MSEYKVFFYFGPRPPRGSKPQLAALQVEVSGVTVGDTSLPYLAMASSKIKKLDGVGTVIRIESELLPLTTAVYRWLLFGNRLVIINRAATHRLAKEIEAGLAAAKEAHSR